MSEMSDSYTETTTESDGENFLITVLLFVLGVSGVLYSLRYQFDNETSAIKQEQSLALGSHLVAKLRPETAATLEGKLVYYTADAKAEKAVTDPLTGVSVNGLRLQRVVETYNWYETSESSTIPRLLVGGTETTTTYTYKKAWVKKPLDSSQFRYDKVAHANPKPTVTNQDYNASRVLTGNYVIPHSMLSKLPTTRAVDPHATLNCANLEAKLKKPVHLTDSVIYVGKDSAHPEIGDLRITYFEAPAGPVSLVAQKAKNTFAPYAIRSGEIFVIQPGVVPVKSVFKHAQEELADDLSGKRCLALLFTFVSCLLLMAPVSRVLELIPFADELFAKIGAAVSIVCALVLNGLVVAGVWVCLKPLFAFGVLVALAIASVAVIQAARLVKRVATMPATR